jgi:RNA polymerase sigma-70 factor (ECF subfamily)
MPPRYPSEENLSLQKADDSRLVALVQSGSLDAFDEIDRRYRGKLRVFLLRYTGSSEEAEEWVQMALIRAFRAIGQLRAQEKLSSWLYAIAFRTAAGESRKKRPVSRCALERIDPHSDPSELVDRRERKINLWKIARRVLDADQHAALWLRYVEGHSIRQIAKVMHRTRVSVRVLLYRARKRLAPYLEDPRF